jgi:DNA-binding sugar fermentation-stimulating protein
MDCAGLITPGRRVHVAPLASSSSAKRTSASVVLAHDTRSDGSGDAAIVANPGHAERLAAASLRAGAIPELGAARSVLAQQTVSAVGSNGASSTSSSSRTDFVLERADGSVALVEVKIVVCADYESPMGRSPPLVPEVAAAAAPKTPKKAATAVLGVYCSSSAAQAAAEDADQPPYTRTAIFPHGHAKKEVGVVSDRAIKHVHHLEQLLQDGRAMVGGKERRVSSAAVLFVVARSDCAAFRPCHEACPVFARVLRRAASRGVQVLAYDVSLDLGGGNGGEATMALRRRLPVVLDAMGKEAEDDADLDATIKRVLEFNATDVRTHWKAGGGNGGGGGKGKKKTTAAAKKKKKRGDSDSDDDDDDDEDDDDDDDDDYGPPKKKKAAAAAKGAGRRR